MNRTASTFAWAAAALLAPAAFAQPPAAEADGLTLLWTERPPFQYSDRGQPKGLLVDLGHKVFVQAGIAYGEKELPANRVMLELQENPTPVCAVGWYKTPEREAFATFSQPIYRDQPLRAVARATLYVEPNVATRAILNNPRLRLLLKQGYSYGPFLDARLARLGQDRVQRSVGDVRNLLQMLQASRADVIFLSQEEIDYFGKTEPDFSRQFKAIALKDAPPSEHRYIMCNRQVPAAVIKKINAAIAAAVPLK